MKKRRSVVEDEQIMEKVSAGNTAGGKPISVVRDSGHPHLWKVQFDNGGELPRELKSLFVSDRDALAAISMYLKD